MKILMRNVGMTLHVIHKLRERGITNVQVNMDWQHLLMNGESLGEYAAMLAAEGLLGHQHANSGWGTFDDDNMVGATAFMETLELAVELRRARLRRERRAARARPVPVHRGRRRRRRPQREAVEVHLGRLRPDRRRRPARGAVAQGRRPRLRARVRRARCVTPMADDLRDAGCAWRVVGGRTPAWPAGEARNARSVRPREGWGTVGAQDRAMTAR